MWAVLHISDVVDLRLICRREVLHNKVILYISEIAGCSAMMELYIEMLYYMSKFKVPLHANTALTLRRNEAFCSTEYIAESSFRGPLVQ